MRKLEGKTAVITGCNRGIGRAILERFASEGANVVACTRILTEEVNAYYHKLETQYDIKIFPIGINLSEEEEIANGIKKIIALKIPVDILVNNAGIASFNSLLNTSMNMLREIFQVNYYAPVQLTQGLLMSLARSKNASIINVTSVAAIDGTLGNTAYGASKAALALMTKSLSKEVSRLRIRVNAIAPGYIDTDMQNGISETILSEALKSISLHRVGTVEEVANLALFLASSDSSYVNGQIIRVDGGL